MTLDFIKFYEDTPAKPSEVNYNFDLVNGNIEENDKWKSDIENQVNNFSGLPVGTIIMCTATSAYTPENTVYTNGAELSEAQFSGTYEMLESGKLESCTYEEYENSVTQTGECWICALDTNNKKFKVPTIKDVEIRGLAKDTIPVRGNGMNLGLTNGTTYGTFGNNDGAGNGDTRYFAAGYKALSGPVYAGTQIGNGVTNYFSTAIGVSTDENNSGILANTKELLRTQTIRHYYVVATGSINQSEIDWSQWETGIQNKANIDMDNLTTTGKSTVTSLAFPSAKYDNLTVGANDATYTAPADGWYCFRVSNGGLAILNQTKNIQSELQSQGDAYITGYLPAAKGDKISIGYFGTPNYLRFIYAKGANND